MSNKESEKSNKYNRIVSVLIAIFIILICFVLGNTDDEVSDVKTKESVESVHMTTSMYLD